MTITDAPLDRLEALDAKLDRLTEQMAVLTAEAELHRRQMESVADLTADLSRVSEGAVAMITERLATADDKGYFRFATAAAGVADRVVTNFDEHDVELLGDNVVAILEALRGVTQPEMLAFIGNAVEAVQAEQHVVATEPVEPPSLWALARQIADPDVRRGMSRALQTLRAVSVETGPGTAGVPSGASTSPTHGRPVEPQDKQGEMK